MRVVVPTPVSLSPAILALREEGVQFEIALCEGRYDYGWHLTQWWLDGTGFILVEWDVVPWPGALQAMWECDHDYCAYRCPLDQDLVACLNCVKFSASFTKRHAELPRQLRWSDIPWNELDGSVCLPVRALTNGVHEHHPPVAHVRYVRAEIC